MMWGRSTRTGPCNGNKDFRNSIVGRHAMLLQQRVLKRHPLKRFLGCSCPTISIPLLMSMWSKVHHHLKKKLALFITKASYQAHIMNDKIVSIFSRSSKNLRNETKMHMAEDCFIEIVKEGTVAISTAHPPDDKESCKVEQWIVKDKNGRINYSNHTIDCKMILKRIISMYPNLDFDFSDLLSFLFPVDENISNKLSESLKKHEEKGHNIGLKKQCSFSLLEYNDDFSEIIGPFFPVEYRNPGSRRNKCKHSEDECIHETRKILSTNNVKSTLFYSKNNPCLWKSLPCMIKIANFSNETAKDTMHFVFSDIHMVNNFIPVIKNLENDNYFKDILLKMNEIVKIQHNTSEFDLFKMEKDKKESSKAIKTYLTKQFENNSTDLRKFISKLKIKFPQTEKTLDEINSFGENESDRLVKILMEKNINKDLCNSFRSHFCLAWYKEVVFYKKRNEEDFFYEKLNMYINIFAVKFIYEDIKAATHFKLTRVKIT